MTVAFSVGEQARNPSWRASDYFVLNRTLTGVILGERDFKLMRLLFENKIVSRDQQAQLARACQRGSRLPQKEGYDVAEVYLSADI